MAHESTINLIQAKNTLNNHKIGWCFPIKNIFLQYQTLIKYYQHKCPIMPEETVNNSPDPDKGIKHRKRSVLKRQYGGVIIFNRIIYYKASPIIIHRYKWYFSRRIQICERSIIIHHSQGKARDFPKLRLQMPFRRFQL